MRANALAAEWPVARISVGKISVVDTQVVQEPPIINMRAKNAKKINTFREASTEARHPSSRQLVPPPIYVTVCVAMRPHLSIVIKTMINPTTSDDALIKMAL